MARRTLYIILAVLALIVASWFVVAETFPKETSRFPIFVLGLLLDLYLWVSIRKMLRSWKRILRFAFTFIYWLPFALMIVLGIASLFANLYLWKPHLVTYVGGVIFIVYGAKLFSIAFFLLADLIKIIRHVIRFTYHKSRKKPCPDPAKRISRANFLRNIGLIGGGFVLSGMIIGAVRWAYDFRIRRVSLRYPVLPRELEGVKMVQISDLHLGSWTNKDALKEAVEVINNERPDFIFFTGDLVNFLTREAYIYKDILKELKAKYGVYAVLGNHDYGDYVKWEIRAEKEQNLRDLEKLYDEMGWQLLRNEHKLIQVNGIPVAVAGVENWSMYERFPRYGDLNKALDGGSEARFKILLSHDPSHWDKVVSQQRPDVNITLSGHTHGFQFGVELKNFRWSPAQYMYKRWAGLYSNPATDNPQYLYVNRGLGMIGYPGRIGILPEIAVLELTSDN
ncbi:MAG: metallophosphoesterase [Bacteroidetes bacterium]|nr:MAG: metallophosphoesterase [Bacteroidota bacterium]